MKFLIVTKKQIITVFVAVLALTLTVITSFTIFATVERKLPIYCVERTDKKIAISFDAAWGNDDTETLIKILKEYDVPATFFVVGAWVDKYPESVKALSNAGFDIENHSNSHPYMTKISTSKIEEEINACNQKIKAITGKTPTLFRPPYGDYDNIVVSCAEKCGTTAIQWSVDSHDWMDNATAQSIAQRVISKTQNGSIILCHNDAEHTPEALPTILKTLKEQGYEFVLIRDLILKDNYKIDNTGKQCKAE